MKGDKEDGHGTDDTMTREQLLTDPEQAADFVKRTQIDALAIAKYGIEKDVGYISTGGGAFLEVLEGKTLPAFEILERRAKG